MQVAYYYGFICYADPHGKCSLDVTELETRNFWKMLGCQKLN